MRKCEAFKGSREPNCENDAEYVYYDRRNTPKGENQAILLCKEHLDMALEDCYNKLKED